MSAVAQAREKIKGWRENPLQFVHDNFKVEPDLWQKDALGSLASTSYVPRRRLGMKACTGPGKSTVLAWIGWWRLSCFAEPGEHPKGAALSGEGRDNLRDNLWAELSKWQARCPFLVEAFEWSQERIVARQHRETWFLSARSYAKDADSESIGRSLSGLHSRFPFILLDETGDMPMTVGQKAEQIFTGGSADALIAAAGNPTSTTGLLYFLATKGRAQWHVITITADPDDPKRTPRVPIDHAKEQIALHGRDNPWIKTTLLGEFPEAGFNQLLSLAEVEAAMGRHLSEDKYVWSQKRLGIDVARFGDDRTIIFPRQGLAAFRPVEMRNARSPDIAARVIKAKLDWGSEGEYVDASGGYGAGVIDSMHTGGYEAHEVYGSGKPIDARYFNKRSEIWWEMAEWVKRGAALPNIPSLVRELTEPQYTFQNGKLRVEEKDQVKKRLGFSPDMADALSLTHALPDAPASLPYPENVQAKAQHNTLPHDWDPYAD